MLPLFSKFASVGEKFVSVGVTPTDRNSDWWWLPYRLHQEEINIIPFLLSGL